MPRERQLSNVTSDVYITGIALATGYIIILVSGASAAVATRSLCDFSLYVIGWPDWVMREYLVHQAYIWGSYTLAAGGVFGIAVLRNKLKALGNKAYDWVASFFDSSTNQPQPVQSAETPVISLQQLQQLAAVDERFVPILNKVNETSQQLNLQRAVSTLNTQGIPTSKHVEDTNLNQVLFQFDKMKLGANSNITNEEEENVPKIIKKKSKNVLSTSDTSSSTTTTTSSKKKLKVKDAEETIESDILTPKKPKLKKFKSADTGLTVVENEESIVLNPPKMRKVLKHIPSPQRTP